MIIWESPLWVQGCQFLAGNVDHIAIEFSRIAHKGLPHLCSVHHTVSQMGESAFMEEQINQVRIGTMLIFKRPWLETASYQFVKTETAADVDAVRGAPI